jgi:hypothetical protein
MYWCVRSNRESFLCSGNVDLSQEKMEGAFDVEHIQALSSVVKIKAGWIMKSSVNGNVIFSQLGNRYHKKRCY